MKSVVIIPARYGSTRFPGKPLAIVAGKPMIQRVWQSCVAAVGTQSVYVATDDSRIMQAVARFGGKSVLTGEARNGTERVAAVLDKIGGAVDLVINVQGDAPLTPPWFIENLISAMSANPIFQYGTVAVRLSQLQYEEVLAAKKTTPFSGAFVTFDKNHRALYFSKQIIPAIRSSNSSELPVFKHIGMYAYTPRGLSEYLAFEETVLERTEGLEQLRILEHGRDMFVQPVDFRGRSSWSIDSPEDLAFVERIIAREGELLPS
jgi:3-deoxy-manno-octulosonate cytidylyltransferase (CMP-KDO synthetase)